MKTFKFYSLNLYKYARLSVIFSYELYLDSNKYILMNNIFKNNMTYTNVKL